MMSASNRHAAVSELRNNSYFGFLTDCGLGHLLLIEDYAGSPAGATTDCPQLAVSVPIRSQSAVRSGCWSEVRNRFQSAVRSLFSVSRSDSVRRHSAIFEWSPESSTGGTSCPRNSGGLV